MYCTPLSYPHLTMSNVVANELRAGLGTQQVLTEPIELFVFGKDAGLNRGNPSMVVFPRDTAEVVAVVKIARAHEFPIIARGAGTGLTGGAVATGPSIVLVLTAMDAIEEVDTVNRTAWVGPGVINQDLSTHTNPFGFHFAPDPSSQSACTNRRQHRQQLRRAALSLRGQHGQPCARSGGRDSGRRGRDAGRAGP